MTITPAPAEGTNSIEIGYSVAADTAEEILAMRCAELYNGAQDTRVFVYGDGTNRCFYSGIDFDGLPRADYFPELNVAHVGDANTPVTAMIRHYDRLLCLQAGQRVEHRLRAADACRRLGDGGLLRLAHQQERGLLRAGAGGAGGEPAAHA